MLWYDEISCVLTAYFRAPEDRFPAAAHGSAQACPIKWTDYFHLQISDANRRPHLRLLGRGELHPGILPLCGSVDDPYPACFSFARHV